MDNTPAPREHPLASRCAFEAGNGAAKLTSPKSVSARLGVWVASTTMELERVLCLARLPYLHPRDDGARVRTPGECFLKVWTLDYASTNK
jgi:hypothetical protein